nr:unnamed protein product [Spirometra erinaceieuropaei]
MPQSIKSASNADGASICSKRSKCSTYRKLNDCSRVDENLFGEPEKLKMLLKSDHYPRVDGRGEDVQINVYRHGGLLGCPPKFVHGKPEKLKVYANDFVRELVVPGDNIKEKTILLPSGEFKRIKDKAKFLTPEQIKEAEKEEKALKEKQMMESADRKFEMKKLDIARRVNERLNDLEEEAKQKAQYLLTKAMEQRQEEEDEIKMLNEQIMNAKIQAIRDAQVLEKMQIEKEINDENQRLDNMMEMERQKGIKMQEEIDRRKREEEMLGACEIMKQINQNQQDRLLQLERLEQENAEARRKMAADMLEELDRRAKKRAEQDRLREELNRSNQQMIEMRLKEKEQDRLFDLKILKEQQDKAAREAAYEAEQERIRLEKEMEIARLRSLQEKASDEAAERDALRAKRAQEEAERQFRRKELEAARKLAAEKEEMNRERLTQAENKKRLLAMEVSRERAEFERILRAQKEMIKKDKREAELRKQNQINFCNEIKRQICEMEQERIAERNAFFEEGVRMEEEARLRRLRLEDAKNRKMNELRKAGIPEKYLLQVERKCGFKA